MRGLVLVLRRAGRFTISNIDQSTFVFNTFRFDFRIGMKLLEALTQKTVPFQGSGLDAV